MTVADPEAGRDVDREVDLDDAQGTEGATSEATSPIEQDLVGGAGAEAGSTYDELRGEAIATDPAGLEVDDAISAGGVADVNADVNAGTTATTLVETAAAVAADLRVARVLLRSGNAMSARVQLETLVGRRQLDLPGMLDLAESRWRTGDLDSAGEAVTAYLEAGGEEPLGFLIAAEATAAACRPGEARRLARRALQDLEQPLDAVFAGQPRSSVWPHDPAEPVQPAGTLFAAGGVDAAHGGRIGLTSPAGVRDAAYDTSPRAPVDDQVLPAFGAAVVSAPDEWAATPDARPEYGLWDDGAAGGAFDGLAGGSGPRDETVVSSAGRRAAPRPDVGPDLDAARAALAAGDTRAAAMRLSIVLRASPAMAPAVLDLVGQLPGVDLDLLRGDALRLVGREAAAERAYAAAAETLREGPTAAPPTNPSSPNLAPTNAPPTDPSATPRSSE